jgi:steroid 5-alpha reductase family enzyme
VVWVKGRFRVSMSIVLGLAALALVAAMSGAWAIQRATGNAGWVDAVWSGSTGVVGALCALAPGGGGGGARHGLVAVMALAWGGRLAWHIAHRTRGAAEDPRYAQFRRDWGTGFQLRLFWFLMIQAAAAWVLVLAVVSAARNPAPLGLADALGVIVLVGSVAGEAAADEQLRRFRQRKEGGVCDTGLWGWSRHPNYFFEFMGWCAYPLMAANFTGAYPQGFAALAGPALMFWLLRFVSGVPPLEASMLARRGAAFADYQRRVSAFVPWPPARRDF